MIRQFHNPSSIEEALALKNSHGNTATWFSGGAYLNHIDLKNTFEQVICLEQLHLDTIQRNNDNLEIGSTTHLQDLMDHPSTPDALKQAIRDAAPRALRNQLTVGGDIAMGGDITRLTPCLIALNARLILAAQELPIDEYAGLGNNDLIVKLIIPLNDRPCKSLKAARQANATPICTVAVSMDRTADNRISNPVIAIGAAESRCRRLTNLEEMLQSEKTVGFHSIQSAATDQVQPKPNPFGSGEFNRYITGQTIAECIMSCLEGGT